MLVIDLKELERLTKKWGISKVIMDEIQADCTEKDGSINRDDVIAETINYIEDSIEKNSAIVNYDAWNFLNKHDPMLNISIKLLLNSGFKDGDVSTLATLLNIHLQQQELGSKLKDIYNCFRIV